jgi:hypothetical protein
LRANTAKIARRQAPLAGGPGEEAAVVMRTSFR